jgi:hypothetical protein
MRDQSALHQLPRSVFADVAVGVYLTPTAVTDLPAVSCADIRAVYFDTVQVSQTGLCDLLGWCMDVSNHARCMIACPLSPLVPGFTRCTASNIRGSTKGGAFRIGFATLRKTGCTFLALGEIPQTILPTDMSCCQTQYLVLNLHLCISAV